MLKKSEQRRLEAKKREWDRSLRAFDRWKAKLKEMVKRHSKSATDWLLFYQPKDTWDKAGHIIEVVLVYMTIFKAFGLW